jgi:CRP/FNR family transcriptional regulator, cyclic AMP receptor protein
MHAERGSHRDIAAALENAPLDVGLLRNMTVFAKVSEETLERISDDLQPAWLRMADYVYREGDPGSEFYLLLDGELEVLKRSRRGRDTRIAVLGAGDCFGEMAIIDHEPRSASVRAVAPARVLRVSSEFVESVRQEDLRSYAALLLNIAKEIARRLRVADGLAAQVTATMLDEYRGKP